MGLDTVNLVLAYEAAYQVEIPDDQAARMRTPRDVSEFLLPLLGHRSDGSPICVTARSFYEVRRQICARSPTAQRRASPAARLSDLLGPDAAKAWSAIRSEMRCEFWPRLKRHQPIRRWFGGVETLGEAAAEIGLLNPRRFHPEPWTRSELERSIMSMTEYELGLPAGEFTAESRYVEDMRID